MDKQTIINKVLIPIENAGFKAYFVGGCVRDELMLLLMLVQMTFIKFSQTLLTLTQSLLVLL